MLFGPRRLRQWKLRLREWVPRRLVRVAACVDQAARSERQCPIHPRAPPWRRCRHRAPLPRPLLLARHLSARHLRVCARLGGARLLGAAAVLAIGPLLGARHLREWPLQVRTWLGRAGLCARAAGTRRRAHSRRRLPRRLRRPRRLRARCEGEASLPLCERVGWRELCDRGPLPLRLLRIRHLCARPVHLCRRLAGARLQRRGHWEPAHLDMPRRL